MSEKFDQWGIIELFGHQRTAGRLTEEMIAGSNLLRVDIPVNARAKQYQAIKPGLLRCECGGVLRPQEKTHRPPEKPA